MATENNLAAVDHVVVLMLENRSFDHMLGFLYTSQGNVSPSGQPYEGLTGTESNRDSSGNSVTVFPVTPSTPSAYFMPGADPGEGYLATNNQLYGTDNVPSATGQPATCQGFVTDYAYTLGWEKTQGWSILPGTTVNDITETRALHLAFGDHARRLAISSTKAMHGHTLGAAGAIESAAAILAISGGTLPPTIHFNEPDPECDLDYIPNCPRKADVEYAISSSFAFGGLNAVLAWRRF